MTAALATMTTACATTPHTAHRTLHTAPTPTVSPGVADVDAIGDLRAAEVRASIRRVSRAAARHRAHLRQIAAAAAAREAAAAPVPVVTGGTATADDFARLRGCESGGNYAANTGNGYYGAYQFALGTWRSTLARMGVTFTGLPSEASPALQDAAARSLQSRAGWGPWPHCSAVLGLRS